MNIKEYLQTSGMTQSEFAHLVDVSQGMVGHWIAGRHRITPEQAVVIEKKTHGALKKEQLVFGDAA